MSSSKTSYLVFFFSSFFFFPLKQPHMSLGFEGLFKKKKKKKEISLSCGILRTLTKECFEVLVSTFSASHRGYGESVFHL